MNPVQVCVIGSGYVGTVVAAGLAHVGHTVIGVETDDRKLAYLQAGKPPFRETGLEHLLGEGITAGRLSFQADLVGALRNSTIVFICVGTPQGLSGEPDMSAVIAVAQQIAPHVDGHILVNKSTVPVGSGRWLSTLIEESVPQASVPGRFTVVSNPEFLREGSAISDFLHPDRIVLGSDSQVALDTMAELYAPIICRRIEPVPVLRTDLVTAEMLKYASNAFLATKISFANELARLCELAGADICKVSEGMGLDQRIGASFLAAGLGWGGSCFGKDTAALIAAAQSYGYQARILEAAVAVNQDQRSYASELLVRHLHTLRGIRVAVLGVAFKAGTDDLRDSPALAIIRRLKAQGCFVHAYDPAVTALPDDSEIALHSDPYDAARGVDAILIATEWPQFAQLDLARLHDSAPGALLLDGRNLIDPIEASSAGFHYQGIGRGTLHPYQSGRGASVGARSASMCDVALA
jgi:UDPglucose 6-dehydrogenase